MNRIEKRFRALAKSDDKALIAYIMAGDPDLETTGELILALEEGGADIIELGVPFSDPLADGPVIQRASERALASKTSLKKVLGLVKDIRKKTDIPIILMTYYNIIYKYGEADFASHASSAGVDGVIIPDLPPEEGSDIIGHCRSNGIDTIFLLAPTSNDKRIRKVSLASRGFVYYVSLTGVTGVRTALSDSIKPMTDKIRKTSKRPLAVGFGISNARQAAEVAANADGVVVGSAIVKLVEENIGTKGIIPAVKGLASELKAGISAKS
ncbi:MAG: tryptophan synthase subunit alpha [Proteobacteria bacterium]|nr:tryptophan synthase subunit alpha [Pseudomonadota bacterium]